MIERKFFIGGVLYSRTGKAKMVEAEKKGKSVGILIERQRAGSSKKEKRKVCFY